MDEYADKQSMDADKEGKGGWYIQKEQRNTRSNKCLSTLYKRWNELRAKKSHRIANLSSRGILKATKTIDRGI